MVRGRARNGQTGDRPRSRSRCSRGRGGYQGAGNGPHVNGGPVQLRPEQHENNSGKHDPPLGVQDCACAARGATIVATVGTTAAAAASRWSICRRVTPPASGRPVRTSVSRWARPRSSSASRTASSLQRASGACPSCRAISPGVRWPSQSRHTAAAGPLRQWVRCRARSWTKTSSGSALITRPSVRARGRSTCCRHVTSSGAETSALRVCAPRVLVARDGRSVSRKGLLPNGRLGHPVWIRGEPKRPGRRGGLPRQPRRGRATLLGGRPRARSVCQSKKGS